MDYFYIFERKLVSEVPRFTLRVWIALTAYMLHEESEIREEVRDGQLTPEDYALLASQAQDFGSFWRDAACDHDDTAIHGWGEFTTNGVQ